MLMLENAVKLKKDILLWLRRTQSLLWVWTYPGWGNKKMLLTWQYLIQAVACGEGPSSSAAACKETMSGCRENLHKIDLKPTR